MEPAPYWMTGLLQPGAVIAEKYRVDRLVGRGGMGAVFAATHLVSGKTVAIKWLLPDVTGDRESVQRFVREAQAAARIRHPNVVDIYDVGLDDRGYYLVMEYLEGEPLSSALERGGYTVPELIDWLLPAARALAAAHRVGVVHRDLKPANIFLEASPEGGPPATKLLDFGIAKVAEENGANLTRSGTALGTPQYMAPEQIRGLKDVDHRVDIYALGVLLYHGLTGRKPFAGDNFGAVAIEVATALVVPPRHHNPNLDPGLEAIVLRAMSRDPMQRFQRMEDMAVALSLYGTDPRAIGNLGATPFHLPGPVPVVEPPRTMPTNPAQRGLALALAPPAPPELAETSRRKSAVPGWVVKLGLGFAAVLLVFVSGFVAARFFASTPVAAPAALQQAPALPASPPAPAPARPVVGAEKPPIVPQPVVVTRRQRRPAGDVSMHAGSEDARGEDVSHGASTAMTETVAPAGSTSADDDWVRRVRTEEVPVLDPWATER